MCLVFHTFNAIYQNGYQQMTTQKCRPVQNIISQNTIYTGELYLAEIFTNSKDIKTFIH